MNEENVSIFQDLIDVIMPDFLLKIYFFPTDFSILCSERVFVLPTHCQEQNY